MELEIYYQIPVRPRRLVKLTLYRMAYRSSQKGRKFNLGVQRSTYTATGKRRRMAEAGAALIVSKVAQRQRSGRGMQNASVFQQVRRGPELKYLDLTTTPVASLAGTGSINFLNACAQGIDANMHIGRQSLMKSLYWMWQGRMPATTTLGGSIRLVILYDKEAEGAAPTIATGGQADAFNQDNIWAQMNLNNRNRFVVVVDEIIECLGTAGPQAFFRKGYRKIALPVTFNADATAAITAINQGSLYAFCWANGFATLAPTTTLQTRIRFEDA